MRFEKRKSCKIYFANHDFGEIKSCHKANHTFNTSVKLMHTIKLIAPRKVRVIAFML